MPKIRLIVEQEDGTEYRFALQGDLDSLDHIDEAVENFKNLALPQVEQPLLVKSQEQALSQEKKHSRLRANGFETVQIRDLVQEVFFTTEAEYRTIFENTALMIITGI